MKNLVFSGVSGFALATAALLLTSPVVFGQGGSAELSKADHAKFQHTGNRNQYRVDAGGHMRTIEGNNEIKGDSAPAGNLDVTGVKDLNGGNSFAYPRRQRNQGGRPVVGRSSVVGGGGNHGNQQNQNRQQHQTTSGTNGHP
jgi:hypothetical protein